MTKKSIVELLWLQLFYHDSSEWKNHIAKIKILPVGDTFKFVLDMLTE